MTVATAHIAFGGNLGDPAATWGHALEQIVTHPACRIRRVSSLFRTRAVGKEEADYLNAAAEVETGLQPDAFLALLQEVEGTLGRVRSKTWGSRPIDLDLIFFNGRIIVSPELVVPHPSAWHRRFVLDPLAEIADELIHPVKQVSVAALRARLLPRPLPVAIAGGEDDLRQRSVAVLQSEFANAAIRAWDSQQPQPAILFWLGDSARSTTFESLPLIPRLDVATARRRDGSSDAIESMRYVLQSALDEPAPVEP